ncbi:MAG: orotidine-5'-phosphate decarboxylase, partial [Paludibacteraceae bacterium]|nr:orotidine-5'-phosphate decarboxylase [Paludibacteraceae bacterium]
LRIGRRFRDQGIGQTLQKAGRRQQNGRTQQIECRMRRGNARRIQGNIGDVVVHYAKNAQAAGLDGVVCSPLEAGMVKAACGTDFVTVTPGIRFADGVVGDQVRITTPEKAREIGSDYIVVGRPITAAEDPVAAYKRCVAEFCKE